MSGNVLSPIRCVGSFEPLRSTNRCVYVNRGIIFLTRSGALRDCVGKIRDRGRQPRRTLAPLYVRTKRRYPVIMDARFTSSILIRSGYKTSGSLVKCAAICFSLIVRHSSISLLSLYPSQGDPFGLRGRCQRRGSHGYTIADAPGSRALRIAF